MYLNTHLLSICCNSRKMKSTPFLKGVNYHYAKIKLHQVTHPNWKVKTYIRLTQPNSCITQSKQRTHDFQIFIQKPQSMHKTGTEQSRLSLWLHVKISSTQNSTLIFSCDVPGPFYQGANSNIGKSHSDLCNLMQHKYMKLSLLIQALKTHKVWSLKHSECVRQTNLEQEMLDTGDSEPGMT